MRVLIRADISSLIGTGHVIRCRSLARSLRRYGADVRFCGRFPKGVWTKNFAQEFDLFLFDPSEKNLIHPLDDIWLPCSEKDDAQLTLKAHSRETGWHPDWIVVDHYGLSETWHKCIRNEFNCVRIAVIDDLANRRLDPDLLIDHNYFGQSTLSRYKDCISTDKDLRYCLGPQFALIDPFFAGFKDSILPRRCIRRLLISFGGAGNSSLLLQVLEALASLQHVPFQTRLVMGSFSGESGEILRLCHYLQVDQVPMLPSLAPLMAGADLSIGAGGTSTWERLCLGLPSITYSLATNQESYSESLASSGLIQYMGRASDFSSDHFKAVLNDLINCPTLLERQSILGMKLVDGFGCERVARLMLSELDSEMLPTESLEEEFLWSDGLKVNKYSPPSPNDSERILRVDSFLTVIDRLQLMRRSPEWCQEYVGSNLHLNGNQRLKISVLSAKESWMNSYIPSLLRNLIDLGHELRWIHHHKDLWPGDICLLLSYDRIINQDFLDLHNHNLVVHASDLPEGKGWSPMTWQILGGANSIKLTLFEADADLDSGPIYDQLTIELQGDELLPEWQNIQAEATIELCTRWLVAFPSSVQSARPQLGDSSEFARRRPDDSKLDTSKGIGEQFDLLRVVDNESYPAFFDLRGRRYRLSIHRMDQPNSQSY